MNNKVRMIYRNSAQYINYGTQTTSSSVEMVTSTSDPTSEIESGNVRFVHFTPATVHIQKQQVNEPQVRKRRFFGENISRAIQVLTK